MGLTVGIHKAPRMPKMLLKKSTWYKAQRHVCAKARLRNPESSSKVGFWGKSGNRSKGGGTRSRFYCRDKEETHFRTYFLTYFLKWPETWFWATLGHFIFFRDYSLVAHASLHNLGHLPNRKTHKSRKLEKNRQKRGKIQELTCVWSILFLF